LKGLNPPSNEPWAEPFTTSWLSLWRTVDIQKKVLSHSISPTTFLIRQYNCL